MTTDEAKKRIEKLKREINYHRYLYHVLDKQEISDSALDSLKHELEELERQYPQFLTPDSPTQRIGGKPLTQFEKVRHKVPMLSLGDAFSKEELVAWQERMQRYLESQGIKFENHYEYFTELKIDGFAVSLEYENGILKRGSTRGDGITGEDVTQNLKTIDSIPLRIPVYQKFWQRGKLPSLVEVRGEVFMTKKTFERVNKEQKKQGLPLYANPRNTAAGSIRQLDSKIAASRPLEFLAYDLVTNLGQKYHYEEHQLLKELGFKTDRYATVSKNLTEVVKFWEEIKERRSGLSWEIDGLVVSVNNNEVFEKLGVVGKAPRGALAFKFPGKQATTKLIEIMVQVGRTGVLTPVAVLEPVSVGGVTISRATLHNEDEIRRLGLKIGDTVIVQRAGDVIPDIVEVLPNLRTGKEKEFKMPKYCPICRSPLVKETISEKHKTSTAYYCSNKKCNAITREKLYHFVSKKAFDIKGLGPKIIDRFIEEGFIKDASQIFELKKGDIEVLFRFGEKSAQNLLSAISQSKKISLPKLIYALGIRHIGEETSLELAKYYFLHQRALGARISIGSLKDFFYGLSPEKISEIKDIGPVVAQSIYDWFHSSSNLKFLERFQKIGIEIEDAIALTKKALYGKTFVLTGELESMTRDQAKDKIRKLGGEVSESVSKKTSYLVVGRNPGSKFDKAQKLGVKIIGEKEFLEILE